VSRFRYTSMETAYPGEAVDLTSLVFDPPDDYDAGAQGALERLKFGRRAKPEFIQSCRSGPP